MLYGTRRQLLSQIAVRQTTEAEYLTEIGECIDYVEFGIDGPTIVGMQEWHPAYLAAQARTRATMLREVRRVVPRQSVGTKVKNFTKATLSYMLKGRVDRETFDRRAASCFHGCPSLYYSTDRRCHFCRDCECPEGSASMISTPGSTPVAPKADYDGVRLKLHRPFLICPRARKGFSNAD